MSQPLCSIRLFFAAGVGNDTTMLSQMVHWHVKPVVDCHVVQATLMESCCICPEACVLAALIDAFLRVMVTVHEAAYRDCLSRVQQSGAVQGQADVRVDLLGGRLRLYCRHANPNTKQYQS